ncbi:unnamed protein product [Victoria cruziana]
MVVNVVPAERDLLLVPWPTAPARNPNILAARSRTPSPVAFERRGRPYLTLVFVQQSSFAYSFYCFWLLRDIVADQCATRSWVSVSLSLL